MANFLLMVEGTLRLLKPQLSDPTAGSTERMAIRKASDHTASRKAHHFSALALGALWSPLTAFLSTNISTMQVSPHQVLAVSFGSHSLEKK